MKFIFSQSSRWLLSISSFSVCCILGWYINAIFYYVAFGICFIEMILCNLEYNFYFSIFLISNLRILDATGITFLVNICMVLPLVKYIFFYRLRKDVVFFAVAFLLIEVFHIAIFDNWETLMPLLCWIMAFLYAVSNILNSNLKFNGQKIAYAFSLGIIISALVYLLCNMNYTYNIMLFMSSGKRFDAYASDPNYYALYICLAMALLITTKKFFYWDLFIFFFLFIIGFLTASKMCFIMMSFIIVYAVLTQFFRKSDQGKMTRRVILLLAFSIPFFWEYILQFVQNLMIRSGFEIGILAPTSMHQLTTGRSTIIFDYIDILRSDLSTFIFGAGMSYHHYFVETSYIGAHNTYFDIILAWGIIGLILMIYVFIYLFKKYYEKYSITITFGNFLPVLFLLINFLDLSCFNATMFWFVLVIALKGLDNNNLSKIVYK